ncbi:MAG: hypothetical protein HY650_14840 [Acidobacteria bacterium]|nr:hypothetical protein [Acidobacteriota bacterium]
MRKIWRALLVTMLVAGFAWPAMAGDTHGGGPTGGPTAGTTGFFSDEGGAVPVLGDASKKSARMGAFSAAAEEMGARAPMRSPGPLRRTALFARMKLYALLAYALLDDFMFY